MLDCTITETKDIEPVICRMPVFGVGLSRKDVHEAEALLTAWG